MATAAKGQSAAASDASQRAPRRRERQIYDAAAQLIYRKGYAATSNQEVADAVGMQKGSLYYYIDTKEDLLFGVIRQAYDSLGDHLELSRKHEGDELERLRYFIVGYAKAAMDNLVPVAVVERDLRSLSEPRRSEVIRWRDGYEAFLRELIQAGQDAGLVRRSLDTQLSSILIFTQIHGLHVWYSPTGRLSADEVAEAVADLVISGIRTLSPAER